MGRGPIHHLQALSLKTLRKMFTANIIKTSLGGCFIFCSAPGSAREGIDGDGGRANYDIGFEVGCFTTNFANPLTEFPRLRDRRYDTRYNP
jgi:hypothetical protein